MFVRFSCSAEALASRGAVYVCVCFCMYQCGTCDSVGLMDPCMNSDGAEPYGGSDGAD